jgi:hypothetical protein
VVSTLGADSPGRLLRSVFAASPPTAAFVTAGRGGEFPTPSSLAKLMKAAMLAAGIPAEFPPHSTWHAGIAHWRGQGMTDDDVMHHANMHAATYVRHYRRRIRTNAAVC